MKPHLSIIVPIFGVEKYIEKCTTSLFNQSLQDEIEFIFVNDCTKDKSITILTDTLRKFPKRKKQVKIINHEKNLGLAAARSTGIKNAEGCYIAHCDSDDWVEPNMYEKLLTKALAKKLDIVSCGFFIEEENRTTEVIANYKNLEYYLKDVLANKWGTVWRFIARKSLLANSDFVINETIGNGEDYIYTSQILLLAKSWAQITLPLYHYNCYNVSSMMKTISNKSATEQMMATNMVINQLKKRGLDKKFDKEIIARKLFVRNLFMKAGVENWKSVYPDIYYKSCNNPYVSIDRRFIYTMMDIMPSAIMNWIFDIYKRHI